MSESAILAGIAYRLRTREPWCRGRREIIDGWSTGKWMPDCTQCGRWQPTGMDESPRWMWLEHVPIFIDNCPRKIQK